MEILHTYSQLSDDGVFLMILSIVAMIIVLFVGASFLDEKKIKQGVICGLVIVSMILALIVNFDKLPRDTYHEVNLDTLTDFDYKNYEIVSQKGKIVTLREVELIK